MSNAPELFDDDRQWIVNETRASGVIFHPQGDEISTEADEFEVDGTTVSFTVK